MSKVVVVKTQRQLVGVVFIQSLDVGITTIRVEMVVLSTMDVVRMEVLIGSITKLGIGSCIVSVRRKLSGSSKLPITTIGVVGTPHIKFTNPIMTTHVNSTVDQPPMTSMAIRGYKNANAMNPRRGYQEPSIITAPILDHRDGHHVKPNKVAFNILISKKM
jgi:hypothetical protein